MAAAGDHGRSRRLWWLAAGGAAGLALAYGALVRTATGQRLDGTALEHRYAVTEGAARRLEGLVDAFSARSVLACCAVIVLLALVRRRLVLAAGVVVALAGSALTSRALKDHVLTRHDLGFGGVSYNTFPSGHATVGIALALALVMAAPPRAAWATGVAAVVAPAVGTAVLVTGGHRPSDSIGAYLASLVWFSVCAAAVAWFDPPAVASPAATQPPWRSHALAGAAALALLAAGSVRALDGPARRSGVGAGSFVLGAAAIDAVGVATVVAFAAVQHDLVRRRGRADPATDVASFAPGPPASD